MAGTGGRGTEDDIQPLKAEDRERGEGEGEEDGDGEGDGVLY
jgi:hypothetical protein